jgi:acid phosphatase type 7
VCIALILSGLGLAAPPSDGAIGDPMIIALRAKADAHVNALGPTSNYGRLPRLRIDASPLVRTFLRFETGKYKGKVERVNLLVYSRTRSAIGFRVRSVAQTWRERRITYANAPRLSPRWVASGPLSAGSWTAVDVTPLVGDAEDRKIGFALSTATLQSIELASRESGVTGPRLVLEIAQPEDENLKG